MAVLKKKTPLSTLPSTEKPSVSKALPKGEEINAKEEAPKKPEVIRPEPKAEKPAIPAGGAHNQARPRFTYTREDLPELPEQMTRFDMLAMPIEARLKLWMTMNTEYSGERFVTLLRPSELPRKVLMEDIPGGAKEKASRGAYFCAYCGDWMPFKSYGYTGYTKCIGCGISTKDFYTCGANNLWNKEL